MVSHQERLDSARDSIGYICSRSAEQMTLAVPNCPGWTVYNAAVHVGRVGVAWHAMIQATPDDPDSRVRGYADAESRGSGHSPDVLASWALAAVDALDTPDGDLDRACYFSMTGGHGTVGLWGWHAAAELGMHRLDIEAAVGDDYSMSDEQAADAIEYTANYFLPAMARVTENDPGALDVVAMRDGAIVSTTAIRAADNDQAALATVTGAPVDVLLAMWGRPHGPIDVRGSSQVAKAWHVLPSTAFQFGTWD